jgi:hypothetical protein
LTVTSAKCAQFVESLGRKFVFGVVSHWFFVCLLYYSSTGAGGSATPLEVRVTEPREFWVVRFYSLLNLVDCDAGLPNFAELLHFFVRVFVCFVFDAFPKL